MHNTDALTSAFFESTFKEFGKLPNKTEIIAGDFNVMLNTDSDKFGGNSVLYQMPRNIILNNKKKLQLN